MGAGGTLPGSGGAGAAGRTGIPSYWERGRHGVIIIVLDAAMPASSFKILTAVSTGIIEEIGASVELDRALFALVSYGCHDSYPGILRSKPLLGHKPQTELVHGQTNLNVMT